MALPELINRAAAAATDVVYRISDPDLDAESTCADWSVRQLINHMTGFLPYAANAARRGPEIEGEAPDFAASPTWADEFAAMAADLVAAWSSDDALEGTVEFGPGEFPAPAAAGITLMELTVHAWDLARSTGVDFATDDDISAAVLEVVEGGQAAGPNDFFRPPVDPPEDASPLELALALSGRNPRG